MFRLWLSLKGHYLGTYIHKVADPGPRRKLTMFSSRCVHACSGVSGSLPPHGLQLTRLLCPWDFPGKNTEAGCHALFQGIFPTQIKPPISCISCICCCCSVTQSCPTLCNPMDYSPPGSSVHGIFQARILGWVAIPFSRVSSRLRDRTQVSSTARQILYCLSHQGS